MAQALIENVTVRAIEHELGRLGVAAADPGQSVNRTRVMTHMAWVPPEWEPAARAVLDNLGERHPSRTIILFPDPSCERDALDAEVDLRCFDYGGPGRSVCSEVVAVWLRGRAARAPASVAQPLLAWDLPAFLRWRGALPFGAPELEQLVDVADRLIVDSTEWPDPEAAFAELPTLFDRIVVSDIAWARLEPWRRALAALWPATAGVERLSIVGPTAEGLLLQRWLATRLERMIGLDQEPSNSLECVEADDRPIDPSGADLQTPSDLLSNQLEIYGPDPVYEAAVRGVS